MNTGIYFELDEEKKRKFNIALATAGEKKTDVLNQFIDDYISKIEKGNKII